MQQIKRTVLEMVNHVLSRHPELAPNVEALAARAQGRSAQDWHSFQEWLTFKGMNTQEVFSKIYEEGHWGRSADPHDRFYSGTGSRDAAVVTPYVQAVTAFLERLGHRPDVVDLGCGDFRVGAQIRPACARYTACDIVPALIAHHRQAHAHLDVDFRVLDLSADELPPAEVVFVRQVFQHLSNAQIAAALHKIQQTYRYLVLTEHLPAHEPFVPNLDKPAGRNIRHGIDSGVVLTHAPFDLRPVQEQRLCEVPETGGVIRTTLYQLS